MTVRTLTILFTDLVGSTELRLSAGERRSERSRIAHFDALRHELTRHAGQEIKTLGDGVMATFDAAADGIRCAIAMQRSTGFGRADNHGYAGLRVGLSSGDVAIEPGDCFGIPVIEAARLCAIAAGGQVVLSESTRLLARDYSDIRTLGELSLKGLAEPTLAHEATWSPDTHSSVRAVLADDSVLVREGIAQLLESAGIEVVGQAGDAQQLLRLTNELRPDLAIVDLRMPPTFTDEGLKVAAHIRSNHPATGVLLLTQELEPRYARRLAALSPTGVGYLHKESVTDLRTFTDAARCIAAGGTVFQAGLLCHEAGAK